LKNICILFRNKQPWQVNCSELKYSWKLPKVWILQFYICKSWNSTFDLVWNSINDENYRLIYFNENKEKLLKYKNSFEDNANYFIDFEVKKDMVYSNIIEFEKEYPWLLVSTDWDELNFIDLKDDSVEYYNPNHKILGFPSVQNDPRVNEKYTDYICLFNLELNDDDKLNKLWNYWKISLFVNPENLEKLIFDSCILNYEI